MLAPIGCSSDNPAKSISGMFNLPGTYLFSSSNIPHTDTEQTDRPNLGVVNLSDLDTLVPPLQLVIGGGPVGEHLCIISVVLQGLAVSLNGCMEVGLFVPSKELICWCSSKYSYLSLPSSILSRDSSTAPKLAFSILCVTFSNTPLATPPTRPTLRAFLLTKTL